MLPVGGPLLGGSPQQALARGWLTAFGSSDLGLQDPLWVGVCLWPRRSFILRVRRVRAGSLDAWLCGSIEVITQRVRCKAFERYAP